MTETMTYALYVDDVPVLFGSEDRSPLDEAVLEALGDRARHGPYDGPYPLEGEPLDASLAKLEEIRPIAEEHGFVG